MLYDVSLRIQGSSANADSPMIFYTQGTLEANRGQYQLRYDQFEGNESVQTTISMNKDTVSLMRNDHTTVMFTRDRPSIQHCVAPTGQTMNLTVVPYAAQVKQSRGRGWMHLVYDLVYDGRFTSNHDLFFEFEPIGHGTSSD